MAYSCKMKGLKIAIGSDHRGFFLKEFIKKKIEEDGLEVLDIGCENDSEPFDYPDFAIKVGEAVSEGKVDFGILVCMTGIGMSISANKVKGIRAALCYDTRDAYFARAHNNANVLCLSAKNYERNPEECLNLVKTFLLTPFEGGRHTRRVDKIISYENKNSCK